MFNINLRDEKRRAEVEKLDAEAQSYRKHYKQRNCLDCGVSFWTIGANYCNLCVSRRRATKFGGSIRPDKASKQNFEYIRNACVDCKGDLGTSTLARCNSCQSRFESMNRRYKQREEAWKDAYHRPTKEYGITDCQQPEDQRHHDCRGRFLRTQSAKQSVCLLCQRHVAKIGGVAQ